MDYPGLQVLDVREPAQWTASRIPGSVNPPYDALEETPLHIDLTRPIAVACGASHRSAVGRASCRTPAGG